MTVARAGARRFGNAQSQTGRRRAVQSDSVWQANGRTTAWSEDSQGGASGRDAGMGNSGEQKAIGKLKQLSSVAAASIAIAIVGVGFGLWQSTTANAAVDAATRNQVSVLVANRDIRAGEAIADADVKSQMVPEAYRCSGVYQAASATAAGVAGARALVDIPAGSQLNSGVVAASGGDGRLSASLASGMEAVSISVNDETGVAGQIKPLDYVRVVSVEPTSSGATGATELCSRARVLSTGGDGSGEGVSYAAVTIEVSPDEANELRSAQASGKVSLQLIAASDSVSTGE